MDQRTLPQPIPLAKKIKGKFIEIEKIKKDSGFAWELEHKETGEVVGVVDPSTKSDCQRNGLTYVNSACHLFQQDIVAVLYRRKIWYRVVQPIALGDELLTHYGGSYSKILGIHKNFRLSKDVCKRDEDESYENPSNPTNLKSSQGAN